jgi:hypothetical protein
VIPVSILEPGLTIASVDLTTTMSMRPTHMALLQIPVVQVESGWLAGVQ